MKWGDEHDVDEYGWAAANVDGTRSMGWDQSDDEYERWEYERAVTYADEKRSQVNWMQTRSWYLRRKGW